MILSLDFGGSALKYAFMRDDGVFIEKGKVDAPVDSEEQFLDSIMQLFHKYSEEIEGIAISSPGQLNPETGFYYSNGQYPFLKNQSIFDVIAKRTDVAVSLENDANCAVLAEHKVGSLKGEKNALMLVLGTGIGGGIIINNQLFRGNHFTAGEFSLIRVDGSHESVEHSWMFQGGIMGITKMVQEALQLDEKPDGVRIFQYVEEGNEAVLSVVDEFTRRLAVQIYNLQAVFDVDKIAIGGGISAQQILIMKINEHLEKIYALEEKYSLPPVKPQVLQSSFGNDANLLGAFYVFKNRNKG